MSRSVIRDSAVGAAIRVVGTCAVAIIAERLYARLRHGSAESRWCWPSEKGWERPTGPGILERDADQSLLRVMRDGEPPPWWVEHRVAEELNDRPRKRFGFYNPNERLAELLLH